jgi:hypothetical protein
MGGKGGDARIGAQARWIAAPLAAVALTLLNWTALADTTYDFAFAWSGTSATGQITLDSHRHVLSAANVTVGGEAAHLFASGDFVGYGTQPKLKSLSNTAALQTFYTFGDNGYTSEQDVVFKTATAIFVFSGRGGGFDEVEVFGPHGGLQETQLLTSESLTATGVPAPRPGAGWLAWLAAGLAGLLFGAQRLAVRWRAAPERCARCACI